ncbi:(3R)-3-hydroxyacyl-CoA dehydrogenase isoform X1 [Anarrhichthys ocellatus]|uniref:(3R)-3-hydroxyacyl-CoA dehydrogenase isoform X1 n=1 Tax=Anarrhichthys ocellatus TaxID=433405 RepID=UPI0012ECBD4D|nr:estradiol 17-beta-dehydrogenase 8 isoform X1 [Anarrhichthys ocellatus]
MEEDQFDKVVQVNLKGSFLVLQAVAQALVACGAPKGSIVTVGSIVGKVSALHFTYLAEAKVRIQKGTTICVMVGLSTTVKG